MKINRDNYESWFLDYNEGNLDPEEMGMVHLFKIEHPDLADETEEFSPILKADSGLVYRARISSRKRYMMIRFILGNQPSLPWKAK